MKPLVSIVMPNYNNENYLVAALSSVLAQEFKDWELHLVDDGSTDSSVKVSTRFASDKIHIHRIMINSGSPVVPRNFGVQYCRGKYVAFLDSDDKWTNDKLKKQVVFMESGTRTTALTFHDMTLIGHPKKTNWFQLSKPHDGHCFKQMLWKNFIPSSSVMVRRDALKRIGRHNPDFSISHDWDIYLRLLNFGYAIEYIPAALGYLRLHGRGVTANSHQRRKESRQVVRQWRGRVPLGLYYKCLLRYYLAEVYDLWKKVGR